MSRRGPFITTPPKLAHCECGTTTIDGLDSGIPYRVDGIPLNLKGELAARVTGRATYKATRKPGFMSVVYRTVHDIKTETGGPVLARHACTPINPEHIDITVVPAMAAFIDACEPADTPEQDQLLLLNRELGAVVTELPTHPPF